MLKPSYGSWWTAPRRLPACPFGLSLAGAVDPARRQPRHGAAREVLLLIVLTATAVVMMDNLHR